MKKLLKLACLAAMAAACLLSAPEASARSHVKPQWVRRGEQMMNRKRISKNYEFKVFHTSDPDLGKLQEERFDPLLTYVRERYGANPLSVRLDSLVSTAGAPSVYRITFADGGSESVVYARKVAEYVSFDDYVDNEYGFEYDQLYAVSEKNVLPTFDTFEVQECDNLKATLYSLFPGGGQFYKGANLKGAAILGSEILFGAGAIVCQHKKNVYHNNAVNGVFNVDSWESKSISCRDMRNVNLGLMAVAYLFGLYDAMVSEGSSRVAVRAPKGGELTFSPASTGAGVALVYRF